MKDALSILYIDDEPDIRLIVEMSLKLRPDIEVRAVASGEEAMAMLQGGGWRPDLVMVDVMMPGMTGPDLLVALRNQPDTAALPVIFVTARARQQDITQYVALGAKGVITKPFDPIRLADQVIALAQ